MKVTKKFEYNLYGCLECDETIEVSDYLKFESEHLCLKKKSFVNIYELRGLYFKYLTEMKPLTNEQIAYDLTLRTVEVESVEETAKKFHDIIVGKIVEVNNHPDADKLKVCMVDIGEDKNVQIVCGGSNLYKDELVVVCKPGAEVIWHGVGDPVVIKETKMRGVSSYGIDFVHLKKFS